MDLSAVSRRACGVSDRRGPDDPRLRAFGARVRQLRLDRDLTLEALAHDAELGLRQLARVEAGKASPSLLWLYRLADALNVELSELLP